MLNYKSKGYGIFQALNVVFMYGVMIACLGPFIYILAISFSSPEAAMAGKVFMLPVGFTLDAYIAMMNYPLFIRSFLNSVIYTSAGTFISLFMTVICAYPLSKKSLFGRKYLMNMVIFSMFFAGGLIPNYIVVSSLGFTNTLWAIVIPGAINQFYLIIVISFMQGIPKDIEDAAAIDGMNPIQTMLRIVLPLSKPVLAAIGLFVAVGLWNDWFYSLIYLNSNTKFPMMLFLMNIIQGANANITKTVSSGSQHIGIVGISAKTTTIILVSLPIILVYPFLQKYFVKGIMIGSIKG